MILKVKKCDFFGSCCNVLKINISIWATYYQVIAKKWIIYEMTIINITEISIPYASIFALNT